MFRYLFFKELCTLVNHFIRLPLYCIAFIFMFFSLNNRLKSSSYENIKIIFIKKYKKVIPT
jgi:hypothetical protein